MVRVDARGQTLTRYGARGGLRCTVLYANLSFKIPERVVLIWSEPEMEVQCTTV